MADEADGLTQYEKDRLERIARNRAMLASLQIAEASAEFVAPLKAAQQKAKSQKAAKHKALFESTGPIRRSSRAAAAAASSKLSAQHELPDASLDDQNSDDGASASSDEDDPSAKQKAYDPLEEEDGGRGKSESDEAENSDGPSDTEPAHDQFGGDPDVSDEGEDLQRALAMSLKEHQGVMAPSVAKRAAAEKLQHVPNTKGKQRVASGKQPQAAEGQVPRKTQPWPAPKRKRKSGIVESMAATDEEILQSFEILAANNDGRLTVAHLQKAVSEVLGESLHVDEAEDMIMFANEMAETSGQDVDLETYIRLAKRIIS